MSGTGNILPVYGEGDREAVEGACRLPDRCALLPTPSVSAARCHLPMNGEEL